MADEGHLEERGTTSPQSPRSRRKVHLRAPAWNPPMGRRIAPETVLGVLAAQGITVFTNVDLQRLLHLTPGAAQDRLQGFVEAGVLRRFYHRWYVIRGPAEAEVLREPLFLGTRLLEPSYVAFGSALRFHGWTDRAPRVTAIASPRRSRIRSLAGHPVRVVTLPAFRFFGSATARRGSLEFPVADPEKAIVDAFYAARHCGGMGAVVAALERALASLDLARLEAYAVRMDDRSLCSRLGYVLERLGRETRFLRRYGATTPVKLDARRPRRGRRVVRWDVIDNL